MRSEYSRGDGSRRQRDLVLVLVLVSGGARAGAGVAKTFLVLSRIVPSLGVLAALLSGCASDDQVDPWTDETTVYDACEDDSQCPAAAACARAGVAAAGRGPQTNMCTHECVDDADCPYGGVCANVTGEALCYERCMADEDCWAGFSCTSLSSAYSAGAHGGEAICIP